MAFGLTLGLSLMGSTALSSTPVTPSAFVVGFQADQDEGTSFDWYVDNSLGDYTGHTGASAADAFETIAEAITAASSGESIGVRYQGSDGYNEALTLKDGITISGYGPEKPPVDGSLALTGAVPCVIGDLARVGSNWGSIYKVTNFTKTNFVGSDPFNAHLIEDGTQMMIAMGRQPNPVYRNIESYNLDWLEADTTVVNGSNEIQGHRLPSFTDNYTQAQIENCDVRFHREPNGATRTPVASFDTGTDTINLTDQTQTYETNVYKDRFALVNLVPAMQKGEWGFYDNGDGTADIYFWPNDTANVAANIRYSNIDTLVDGRNAENVTLKSMVFQNTAASQAIGSETPLRFDRSAGSAIVGPFTLSNIKVKNSYSKDDGYGGVYAFSHDNYLIEQSTFEDIRNAFGLFMSGHHHDHATIERTAGGKITRCIVLRADKSPCRIYGNMNNEVSRNWFINSGLAAHANKANHYEGGSKTLWIHNFWVGCSGYWTFQEADSQDFIGNWSPCNFADGRAVVDQNRESVAFSNATTNSVNGDCYILNNDLAPTQAAIDAATFNAISALGNANEDNVNFAVKNNITYGMDVGNSGLNMITNGEGNNVYSGGTKRQTSDVETAYTDIYEDVSVGDFGIKSTSPTRLQAGASLSSIEGTDGAITLAARWPNYDFTKDINGDTWDLANPGVGPAVNPDNYPDFDPVWVERPVISGSPVTGQTVSVSDGICMAINNYVAPTHQWCRVSDPYSDPSVWTEISGATGSTYTAQVADEGSYLAVKSLADGQPTQVIMSAVAQAAYPLGDVTTLLSPRYTKDTSTSASTWLETGTFVTTGKPIIVTIYTLNGAIADATLSVTIGSNGRTLGTGTSLTVGGTVARRTRNQITFATLAAPGSSTQTIHVSSNDTMTTVLVSVEEIEDMDSYVAGSEAEGSNPTSLTPSITTAQSNTIVLYAYCRYDGTEDPVTWGGGTTLYNDVANSGGGPSNSMSVGLAWEQAATTGTYSQTASWSAGQGAATSIALEIRAA